MGIHDYSLSTILLRKCLLTIHYDIDHLSIVVHMCCDLHMCMLYYLLCIPPRRLLYSDPYKNKVITISLLVNTYRQQNYRILIKIKNSKKKFPLRIWV